MLLCILTFVISSITSYFNMIWIMICRMQITFTTVLVILFWTLHILSNHILMFQIVRRPLVCNDRWRWQIIENGWLPWMKSNMVRTLLLCLSFMWVQLCETFLLLSFYIHFLLQAFLFERKIPASDARWGFFRVCTKCSERTNDHTHKVNCPYFYQFKIS